MRLRYVCARSECRGGMTETRARVYAEEFDKRRERERIIAAGDENGPWWYRPTGFLAGLIGSLPDPVNLIPFGGGLASGANLAGMTAGQVVKSSIRPGMIAGAAGNFASANIAALDLNRKGEDLGFQDVMLETMFGAVAGPLFHVGGAFLGRRSARKGIRGAYEGLRDALPEGEASELSRAVEAMKKGDPEAYAQYGKHLEELAGGAERLREMTDFIRNRITPAERMEFARAMELALHDLSEGRPVDVSPVLQDSAVLGKAYDMVLRDPLGGPADEVLAALRSPEFARIVMERGPAFFGKNGELIVSGKHIQDTTGFPRSGGGMVKIIWKHGEKSKESPHLKVTREDVMRLPEILDGYEPIRLKNGRLEWTVKGDDGVPLTIIVGKQQGREPITVITVHRDKNINRQLSTKREAPASLRGSKSSMEDRLTGTEDTAAEASSNRVQQGQGLSGEKILPAAKQVNHAAAASHPLAEHGIDPDTGISLEESVLRHPDIEGRLSQADRDALLAHAAEGERINTLEERAIGIAECAAHQA